MAGCDAPHLSQATRSSRLRTTTMAHVHRPCRRLRGLGGVTVKAMPRCTNGKQPWTRTQTCPVPMSRHGRCRFGIKRDDDRRQHDARGIADHVRGRRKPRGLLSPSRRSDTPKPATTDRGEANASVLSTSGGAGQGSPERAINSSNPAPPGRPLTGHLGDTSRWAP